MKLLPRVSLVFLQQVKRLSSLANKESEITLQTCGKFYAANNKQFLYRNGTPEGISVNVKFLDTNPSSASNTPTVLAIHGSPGNYQDFSDLIERLHAQGVRVIAPNFPNMTLTDSNNTFYHSTGEKYELLTDFLAAIGAPSFDLALMHSSGTYPTMKLWNDKPGAIRSLMWINPAGHRRIKAMKPEWFVSNLARLNMVPVGRWFYEHLGYIIAKAANVKVNTSKGQASNAVLAALTMHLAGVERLAKYAENLKARKTPTSYIFSDKDKLVDYDVFLELIEMLGASKQCINNVSKQGELTKAAEKELDWLRIFNIEGGGHYAFKNNSVLLESEANRLLEKVHSSFRQEARGSARDVNVEKFYRNEGRVYAVNMKTHIE